MLTEKRESEHTHEHHHEACGCGHEHGHDHEACGHEHDHSHHSHEEVHHTGREFDGVSAGVEQKVYILEGLGCANCAAKMERQIRELPGVEMATITFATKQLRVAANHQEELLPRFREICASIEEQVTVTPREEIQTVKKVEKKSLFQENKKEILIIAAGAVLFAAGEIAEHAGAPSLWPPVCYVIAYVLLGWEIVWTAFKNLGKGHVFDENFLMSVATLAAFAIGDFAEAVGVMLFYRVGELFEDVAVARSRSQIMEAVDMRPEVVGRLEDGEVHEIPAGNAAVGDILLVRPGDRIPLDGVVTEGESRIDTSPVTGEPVPVTVRKGSRLVSGCVNEQSVLQMKVEKPLAESMVTKILDSVENAAASKPKLDRFITKFARVYTPIVVLAAVATAIIPSLITGNWREWIYTAITFLVISCPCALVLSVPLAFFSGIGAGSKKGILFKGGVAIEALKNVKAVVMDKTGTITKGEFQVQSVIPFGRESMDTLLQTAARCEMGSTHPIGTSIVEAAREKGMPLERPKEVEEISGKGIHAVLEEREVLCGNKALMEMFHVKMDRYANDQYGTEVLLAFDGELAGCIVIADSLKNEAKDAIDMMKKQGLVTAMFTGDSKESARAVAGEAGIDKVFAQLLPQDKLAHLQEMRRESGAVLFVGDGINDAPVLAGADVGAAMGSGADAAIEAADVVFMTSQVTAVPEAVAIARKTGRIAMQNVVFALAVKALVMILGFAGMANMWMAVFADTGVAMLCVLNSIRALYGKTVLQKY
ncbi:heavy metal translocating P-type ATPase [Lachnoclostridium phocaeense]|uniref:heavy metal translocating P-type ATPase n=1 Tax=Lachnoclostridium phocaeense TaxID=1871021 RepID=UPI00248EAC5B|nr:heavy metal translocating P-type ATPase [Lachnoclostridium phocaeense]